MSNNILSYKVTSKLSKRSLRDLIRPINEIIENFLRDVVLFNKRNRVYNALLVNFHNAFVTAEVIKRENPYFIPETKEYKEFISLIQNLDYFEFFISRKKHKIFIEFYASDPMGQIKGFSYCWEYKIEMTIKGIGLVYVKSLH